ncbi:MAG TPA: elongation factor P [Patescibacteria group bacterium]
MINATELRSGVVFRENGQYFMVITYDHVKMGRGSGTIKVKVRNLTTGSTIEKSFITGARVDEANLVKKTCQYLYNDGKVYNFMDNSTFEQFEIPKNKIEDLSEYLKEGINVVVLMIDNEALGIELPKSMEYFVTEAPPSERGNSTGSVTKVVTLENGLKVSVPMFIKQGEIIKVNTSTGEYSGRA